MKKKYIAPKLNFSRFKTIKCMTNTYLSEPETPLKGVGYENYDIDLGIDLKVRY